MIPLSYLVAGQHEEVAGVAQHAGVAACAPVEGQHVALVGFSQHFSDDAV